MGFCASAISFLLFVSNLMFAMIGIILTGIGVYSALHHEDYYKFLATSDKITILQSGAFITIAVGVLLTLVYLIGCFGACMKNPCMLYTFSFLLSLIILAEIGMGIGLFMFKGKASEIIKSLMDDSQKQYNPNASNATDPIVVVGWNEIQYYFECCGVNGYDDWKPSENTTSSDKFVPVSCCNKTAEAARDNACPAMMKAKPDLMKPTEFTPFTSGCFPTFEKFITENVTIVGGAAIGLAFLQILSIVIACCFAKNEKNGDYDSVNAI